MADGERVSDLLPSNCPNIRLIELGESIRASIGSKFNLGIKAAQGDLLALWADDDWHGPDRLTEQAAALVRRGCRLCGSDCVDFADLRTGELWQYQYIPGRRTSFYVVGGTMAFTREFWRDRPFEDSSSAEDNAFIFQRGEELYNVPSPWYVAAMHAGNTSPKSLDARLGSDQWTRLLVNARSAVPDWWWKGATA